MKSVFTMFAAVFFISTAIAQNVGIGTTTPVNKLSVNGKVNITDSLGVGTTTPASVLHLQSANVSDTSRGDIILSRFWNGNTDTRSSSIFHYFNSVTNSDNLAFGVAGSGGSNNRPNSIGQVKMIIQANGNVGIGTISASNKLSVNGNTDISGNLKVVNPGIGITALSGGINNTSIGIGRSAIEGSLNIAGNPNEFAIGAEAGDIIIRTESNTRRLILNSGSGTAALTVLNGNVGVGGNLGIGTTTPTQKLDVAGTIRTTSLQITNGAASGFILKSDPSGNASWANANTLTFTETDPKVGTLTSNTIPKWNGSVLADGLIFDNGDNVGIGTITPTKKLDVVGTTKTTNLQLTAGASNGYLLKSDATGNASWVNASTVETDPKVGTLTSNKIPKWNGSILADGLIFDNGNNVGIGTTTPANKLSVFGTMDVTESLGIRTTTPAGELHVKSAVISNSIIDQQQTIASNSGGNVLQWQSFTAGVTGVLTRVDLRVSSPISGSPSPGTIKIFMGEGNTGTVLSTTAVTFQPVFNTFQSFTLSSFPAVIAGNKYTIEFSVPASANGWVPNSTNNPYAGGRYSDNALYDCLFKTYVTSEVVDGLVVADGKAKVANLQITNGAQNGYILQSDANGTGSWVNPTLLASSTWTSAGNNQYSALSGNVGIGTSTTAAKLHVASSGTGLRIDVPATQTAFSIGGAGSVKVDAIGVEGGRLLINDNGNMGIGTPTPTTTLDVNGGIRTKYSGTVVFDVVGGLVTTLNITIPALPADWNVGNTIVIVTNADGVDGIVRQAKLTSLTNIAVKYIQDTNGLARLNWVIFRQ